MRHSKETIKEANELISAMQRRGVKAFLPENFGIDERNIVQDMINKAKRHHTLSERFCSEEMTDEIRERCEGKEAGLEEDIRLLASKLGLKVHFDGDPRGFTVKLHAPGGDVSNTWGGHEIGYGIGESIQRS